MPKLSFFPVPASAPYARELQLRCEIVAAMKLRATKSCRKLSVSLVDSRGTEWCEYGSREHEAGGQISVRLDRRFESAFEANAIHILAVSDYEALRTSRELVLRQFGYQVASCGSQSVGNLLDPASFHIVILCQSVDHATARRIASVLKSLNPTVLILRIRPFRIDLGDCYDATMEAFDDPHTLLQRVRFLAQRILYQP